MYIAPEFFVGTILAFILLLFAHLIAMCLLERNNPDKEYNLEFHFPLRFPFKIVSKEKEAPNYEEDIDFEKSFFEYKRIDIDTDKIISDTKLIIEKFKEKYKEDTTQE